MYSDAAVAKDVVQLQKDPTARTLPDLPNVNTLAGRVVLMHVEEFTQREVTERMRRLIEANQEVRQAFSNPSAV
jgi:hypothetical protein